MRCGLTGLVQVPLLVLASGLLLQTPLSAVHAGPAPTFSGSSRSFTPAAHSPSLQAVQPRHWPYGNPSHPTGGDRDGRHRVRYPSVYAGYPWLSFGYGVPLAYGLPYGGDPDDTGGPSPVSQQQADEPPVDYGTEPPYPQVAANAAPSFRPPYQGQSQAAPVHAQPATILIFKDGRPPEKVHNYALTASTLYALDGDTRQEIPLAVLDVPATVETNRAAGVDFALPVSR